MNRGFSLLEASIYLVLVIIIMPLIAMLLFFTVDNRARSNNSSLLSIQPAGSVLNVNISGSVAGGLKITVYL